MVGCHRYLAPSLSLSLSAHRSLNSALVDWGGSWTLERGGGARRGGALSSLSLYWNVVRWRVGLMHAELRLLFLRLRITTPRKSKIKGRAEGDLFAGHTPPAPLLSVIK